MDAEVFKQKFLPYHQKLYRIAFRVVQSEDNAKDILQDAYIRLWEKREELTELENPEAFAITILKNLCLDFLRKAKVRRTEEYTPEMKGQKEQHVSDNLDQKDEANHVKYLIDKLPEQQKMVITYRDCDGYSSEEIETIMGLSAVNVRVLLSRARKTVREQYLKRYVR